MIEGEPLSEIAITNELDTEDELEPNQEWSDLFSYIAMVAEGKDEDCDSIVFEGDIEDLMDETPYTLRVLAPFIDDDSRPQLITLDVYKGKVHTQRAIALAKWNGNDNNILNIINDSVDPDADFFDFRSLANHAIFLVTTAVTDTGVFPIPEEYGNKIH